MNHDKPKLSRSLVAGALLFSIGPAAMLVMPMIVGAYVDELGFSNQQAGVLASFEAAGICAASLLGLIWVKRLNWRLVTLAGLSCAVVANLLSIGLDGFAPMLACRTLASLGAGTAFAAATASLGEQDKPEAAFGIGLAVQTLLLMVIMAMSARIMESHGIGGIFFLLALLAFVVALPVGWLPVRSEKSGHTNETTPHHDSSTGVQIIAGLVAIVLFYAGALGFWVFLERIGDASGHSTAMIGTVLAWALGAGALGGMGPVWLGDRKGIAWPIVASTSILIGVVLVTVGSVTAWLFALSAIVFNGMWIFATAYQTALIAKLDRHGSYTVLIPAAQGAGAMIGPAVASMFVQGDKYLPVNISTVAFFAISLFLFLVVMRGFGAAEQPQ
jgi:predicted MFS family arabinose efflux permease